MQTYEEYISAPYHNDRCAAAFAEVLKDRSEAKLTLALTLALPVLGKVLKSHFHRFYKPGTEVFDEILSISAMRLYEYLLTDDFRDNFYTNPDSQFSFLFGFFRYEVLNTVKRVKRRQEIDSLDAPQYGASLHASSTHLDYRMLVRELPTYLSNRALEKIRFEGAAGELCRTIVNTMVSGRGIPNAVIRAKWGSWGERNKEFFIAQARFAIRSSMLEIRAMVDSMPEVVNEFETTARANHELFDSGGTMTARGGKAEFWFGVDKSSDLSLTSYHRGKRSVD